LERTKTAWIAFALAVLGLGISGYLTWYSFITRTGVCTLTGYFGCSAVLTSAYSRIGGVPVALLGFVWFLVVASTSMLVVRDGKWLKYLLAWSVLGLLGIVGLEYVEIFVIRSICLECTSAHLLGIAVLVLTLSIWLGRRA